MHIQSYLRSAASIIQQYDGAMPFAVWLKAFFSGHKKYGSKDRKHITHLCYCYFRLGSAVKELPIEERLPIALYICSDAPNNLLAAIKPEWNDTAALPPEEKLKHLNVPVHLEAIFPWNHQLSKQIETKRFNHAFLQQLPVYLRIRPGKEQRVFKILDQAAIPFQKIDANSIAVSSSTKLDALLETDRDVVVQDISSQHVLQVLDKTKLARNIHVWDCCAASGGKSILFWDAFGPVQLTVSDVRQSILHNLHKRFAKAGIKQYHSFVGDIAAKVPAQQQQYDVIICDAPCSGSGTWGRTPEQLLFFKEEKIEHYARLQKSIVANAAKALKSGGQLLYITCSVFEKENEEVIHFIQKELAFQLGAAQYFKGYHHKADTLFAAAFTL